MKFWFKPYTHWHEVTEAAYCCLGRAGYMLGPDLHITSTGNPPT